MEVLNKRQQERLKIEKEKQDLVRRSRLTEILGIRPKARTTEQENELYELLLDFNLFQIVATANFELLRILAREIYMECLLPDSVVIKQDAMPENCYIISQGRCKVFVRFKIKKFQKTYVKTKMMCILGNRDHFGELSLTFDSKRTATVETMESCYVIVIPRQAFEQCVREPYKKKLHDNISFFKILSCFSEMDQNTLHILASKTTQQNVQSNTLIIR